MIYRQKIDVDAPSSLGVHANYFAVKNISTPADVVFRGGTGNQWSLKTKIFSGLSLDFESYGSPCTQIVFERGTNQDVEFWAGKARAEINAISGTIGVSAGKRIVYNAKQTITNALAVEVFPLDLQRKIGTFSTSGVVFVGDSVNGIRLEAGLHVWENGQPLNLIAEGDNVEVRSQDEGY